MSKASTEEKQGKAALLFRTTHLTQREIARRVGVSESQIAAWIRDGQWEKDNTQIVAKKTRQLIATGTTEQLDEMDEEKLTDERAEQIAKSMGKAFSNAANAINKAGVLIGGSDTGSKLKAAVEANQKAVTTLREIADLDRSDDNDSAIDKMVANLNDQAEEAIQSAHQSLNELQQREEQAVHH